MSLVEKVARVGDLLVGDVDPKKKLSDYCIDSRWFLGFSVRLMRYCMGRVRRVSKIILLLVGNTEIACTGTPSSS